jgi:hypothetical protein
LSSDVEPFSRTGKMLVPPILNVLVEQAGKPVADIGARWEFVVKEAIEIATIQTKSTPSGQAR